ncbi:MAG: sulfatase-like hydrolase/transferase [bacterium]|nr:DUF229 domain-containing protein [Gammaproteobacteria bacterium]
MPPNILWIIADQLRADHVGFGGNSIVRTPNLDRLAASGTVFDRAYVANPICMPNRCSMLTGRMPSAHGVVFNDRSLNWGANTFVRNLGLAGYDTALIGKSHIQHGMSRNVVFENKLGPTIEDPYPEGWDELENAELYSAETRPQVEDFYGFKHTELAIGHGDMVIGDHFRWALGKGAKAEDLLVEPYPDSPALERSKDWWQIYKPVLPEELYSTTYVTERMCTWLTDNQRKEKPWVAQCSFPDPHHPFTPPGKWWNAYSANDMPIPDSFEDSLQDAPAHLRFIRSLEPRKNYVQMFGPTRDIVKQAMAAEFGMIEMMDHSIGKVINVLETSGQIDNTIIIFTSDHGDMFGDHGLMLKATMHYQECLRVPLLIKLPGATGKRTNALASSLDLSSTMLDFCDVPGFMDMQGVSLKPVLDDNCATVRDHVYIEEDFPLAMHGSPLPLHSRTVITDRHRYSQYSSGDVELYDLDSDPKERDNLAIPGRADSLRGDMSERLSRVMMSYSAMGTSG